MNDQSPASVNWLQREVARGTAWYRGHTPLAIGFMAACLMLAFSWWPEPSGASGGAVTRFIAQSFGRLVGSKAIPLKGEDRGHINVLVTGIGGGEHEGKYLTDSIMIATLNLKRNKAFIASIPRDLIVPVREMGASKNWQKINSINAFAERENERLAEAGKPVERPGAETTADFIGQVFGIDFDYYVRLDFEFFRKAIDDMGGIDVKVERAFTDTAYPTENFGYQTVSFEAGLQHMNGDLALKFVRSRHGNNGENSDFARSRRQQAVIVAILNKAKSFTTLASPSFISNSLENVGDNVVTNMSLGEMVRAASLGLSWEETDIERFAFDDSNGNFLSGSFGADGGQILLPDSGDFAAMQRFVKNGTLMTSAKAEKPIIALVNGTGQSGMAGYYAAQLKTFGFETMTVNGAAAGASATYFTPLGTEGKNAGEWLAAWFETPAAAPLPEMPLTKNGEALPANVTHAVVLGPDAAKYFLKVLNNLQRYEASRLLEVERRAAESGTPPETAAPETEKPQN